VYLEAMATAKPVIACRGQGIEEIIRHRENGWLVEPENREDLVDGLSSLLKDARLRNRLGQEGRRTVVGGLTLFHQAERLKDVYRSASREVRRPETSHDLLAHSSRKDPGRQPGLRI
jgi:teichuronic acid biosynthesis glycosyltransferase TuaC